jgi:hypothetical protein
MAPASALAALKIGTLSGANTLDKTVGEEEEENED